jgi:hypothetical protein
MLSREYAEWRVQSLGNTPARADVAPRPLDDPSKFKLQYAGDDKAERQITEVLKWSKRRTVRLLGDAAICGARTFQTPDSVEASPY